MKGRTMDRIRRIELLVRAADAGSFAKAARSLDLTPSAVSHAITDLEKSLSVSLFHRTTRQLRLTAEGEAVCQCGRDLLRRLAEIESVAGKSPDGLSGTLRVGLDSPLERNIVMPHLPAFLRRHPQLRLEFLNQSLPRDMHSEGVDVLLRVHRPPTSNLIARQIGQIRRAVYASQKYLKIAGTPTTPEDLARHNCLVIKLPEKNRPEDRWEFRRDSEHKVIQVPSKFVTQNAEGLIAAVLAGAGIMRMGFFDPHLISSGQLHRVLVDWDCAPGPPIFAMYRKTARISPKVTAFMNFVEEAFAVFDPEEITLLHRASLRRSP